jgi:hypothetical protein
VEYADTNTSRVYLGDRFADPAVQTAFRAAVLAATGFVVEQASLTVVSEAWVSDKGVVVYRANFSAGAAAGLVLMCLVVTALLVGGVYYLRVQRALALKANGGQTTVVAPDRRA